MGLFKTQPEVRPDTREAVQTISQAQDLLNKQLQMYREEELTLAMLNYMEGKTLPEDLNLEDYKIINKLVEKKIKEIDLKMAMLRK